MENTQQDKKTKHKNTENEEKPTKQTKHLSKNTHTNRQQFNQTNKHKTNT